MNSKFHTLAAIVLLSGFWSVSRAEVGFHSDWKNALKPKGTPAAELTLAAGGRTDYVIVVPASPSDQDEKAAGELSQWLGEVTGARFSIVSESETVATAKYISVGRTELLRRAGLPAAGQDLGDEGYAIAVRGDDLFLLGGKKRGPIYAVFALLEEDLGCRWYTRRTSTIPQLRHLTVRPVPRNFVPVLRIRDPFYWDAFDGTWSLRNRTNAPNAGIREKWGGRAEWVVPVKKLDKDRKYRLRVRVRVDKSGNEGPTFHAGVYNAPNRTYPVGTKGFSAAQVASEEYRWFVIGEFDPQDGDFVYIAPDDNERNVTAVYIDRIELVPTE